MMLQVLSPCMQDTEKANISTEMTRISSDLQQRCRTGPKQQIVHHTLVLVGQRSKLVWNREYDVGVGYRQKLFGALCQPPVSGTGLAPGTVPVAAGVI